MDEDGGRGRGGRDANPVDALLVLAEELVALLALGLDGALVDITG